jgi:sortase A
MEGTTMNARLHLTAVAAACAILGGLLLGQQAWLAAKARVAEHLIDRAFESHLLDGKAHRPWDWADTHPVGRLEVPRLGVRRTVLAGASGSSLAFGPGHVDGTAAPNGRGNSVVAGHRDSWFAFLEQLSVGDEVVVTTHDGVRRYRVVKTDVRSMWDIDVAAATDDTRLTLVTCYPFDGLVGSTYRYVVTCVPVTRDAPDTTGYAA